MELEVRIKAFLLCMSSNIHHNFLARFSIKTEYRYWTHVYRSLLDSVQNGQLCLVESLQKYDVSKNVYQSCWYICSCRETTDLLFLTIKAVRIHCSGLTRSVNNELYQKVGVDLVRNLHL